MRVHIWTYIWSYACPYMDIHMIICMSIYGHTYDHMSVCTLSCACMHVSTFSCERWSRAGRAALGRASALFVRGCVHGLLGCLQLTSIAEWCDFSRDRYPSSTTTIPCENDISHMLCLTWGQSKSYVPCCRHVSPPEMGVIASFASRCERWIRHVRRFLSHPVRHQYIFV